MNQMLLSNKMPLNKPNQTKLKISKYIEFYYNFSHLSSVIMQFYFWLQSFNAVEFSNQQYLIISILTI